MFGFFYVLYNIILKLIVDIRDCVINNKAISTAKENGKTTYYDADGIERGVNNNLKVYKYSYDPKTGHKVAQYENGEIIKDYTIEHERFEHDMFLNLQEECRQNNIRKWKNAVNSQTPVFWYGQLVPISYEEFLKKYKNELPSYLSEYSLKIEYKRKCHFASCGYESEYKLLSLAGREVCRSLNEYADAETKLVISCTKQADLPLIKRWNKEIVLSNDFLSAHNNNIDEALEFAKSIGAIL